MKKNILYLFLLGIIIFPALDIPLFAQELSITSRLDRSEIKIGEQALLSLKIRTEDLDHTLLLIPPDSAIHRAEALSFTITDTIDIDNRIKEITAEMVITSFDSTLVVIPAFGVQLGNKKVFADPLYLKVSSPAVNLDKPDEFNPNKLSWNLHYSFKEILFLCFPWLGGILLLVGIYFLIRTIRRKIKTGKSKQGNLSIEQISLTPLEIFLQRINDLPVLAEDNFYYTQLDLLLRTYLTDKQLINAMEMSSKQLLYALKSRQLIEDASNRFFLSEFLERSDLAKFAEQAFSIDKKKKDKELLSTFVKKIDKKEETSLVEISPNTL